MSYNFTYIHTAISIITPHTWRTYANFLWWKHPRTKLVVFMGKYNNFERKVRCKGLYFFVAYGSCTISCSLRLNFSKSLLILCLVRSVSENRSSASTSSSLFILTEVDLCNKPAFDRADSRLKYQAICCSINQSVLYNISSRCRLVNSKFGKPH